MSLKMTRRSCISMVKFIAILIWTYLIYVVEWVSMLICCIIFFATFLQICFVKKNFCISKIDAFTRCILREKMLCQLYSCAEVIVNLTNNPVIASMNDVFLVCKVFREVIFIANITMLFDVNTYFLVLKKFLSQNWAYQLIIWELFPKLLYCNVSYKVNCNHYSKIEEFVSKIFSG